MYPVENHWNRYRKAFNQSSFDILLNHFQLGYFMRCDVMKFLSFVAYLYIFLLSIYLGFKLLGLKRWVCSKLGFYSDYASFTLTKEFKLLKYSPTLAIFTIFLKYMFGENLVMV